MNKTISKEILSRATILLLSNVCLTNSAEKTCLSLSRKNPEAQPVDGRGFYLVFYTTRHETLLHDTSTFLEPSPRTIFIEYQHRAPFYSAARSCCESDGGSGCRKAKSDIKLSHVHVCPLLCV